MSATAKLEDCDLRPNAETEFDATTDTLVHIKMCRSMAIKAGGVSAIALCQSDAPESWPIHLAAVCMPGEHYVAAMLAEALDGAGVVGQNHARSIRVQPRHRLLHVAAPAPKIVHPG